MSTSLTLMERFWAKVDKAEGCWHWKGSLSSGYGRFRVGDAVRMAHRFYYEHIHGPIANGLELDHVCRNRACVNPAHLQPVTHTENMVRATRLQTHCKQGHEFTRANLYIARRGGDRAQRVCKTCAIAAQKKQQYRPEKRRAYYLAKKALHA